MSAHVQPPGVSAAWLVILAGVCAALHVGKLPPAITALQATLGITLVQAGFLLSLVQLAGMCTGVAFGTLADGLGHRRSLLLGLCVLALASAAGGTATSTASLMLLRAIEGFGFLLVVLPAPAMVRRLVAPQQMTRMIGVWGGFMPLGVALAFLSGPPFIASFGWQPWWWLLAGITAAMAATVALAVPEPAPLSSAHALPWPTRLRLTLGARGPWLVATSFCLYAAQWLAVIGFLPTIYLQAGYSGAVTGVLTAAAAAANVAGNVGAGRLLHRGISPATLLATGFVAMALCSVAAFAAVDGASLPPALRYAAVCIFSALGGLIPSTLFTLAVRLAPSEAAIATSVGFVQQWSAMGQFMGPPLVAWVGTRVGGWQATWVVISLCAAVGLWLATRIGRLARP